MFFFCTANLLPIQNEINCTESIIKFQERIFPRALLSQNTMCYFLKHKVISFKQKQSEHQDLH